MRCIHWNAKCGCAVESRYVVTFQICHRFRLPFQFVWSCFQIDQTWSRKLTGFRKPREELWVARPGCKGFPGKLPETNLTENHHAPRRCHYHELIRWTTELIIGMISEFHWSCIDMHRRLADIPMPSCEPHQAPPVWWDCWMYCY